MTNGKATGGCFSSVKGGRTMPDHIKEDTYDKEMVYLNRIFTGFLFGVGAIMGIWLLSGLLYVILK
jgi:hypothetical protein